MRGHVGAEKRGGPVEVQVVDRRIDESHQPQHQNERGGEQAHGFEPREACDAGSRRPRRCVRQHQAEGRQHQRCGARDDERPLRAGLQRGTGQSRREHGAQPAHKALVRHGGHNGNPPCHYTLCPISLTVYRIQNRPANTMGYSSRSGTGKWCMEPSERLKDAAFRLTQKLAR